MPRKYTDARKENNRKWDAENLDRMSLALPKGQKERIQAAAAASGEKSVNSWISKAIEARLTGAQAQDQAQQQPAQPDGLTVTIRPEDLDKMHAHLELYGLDLEKFIHRAINTQIKNDLNAKTLGIPMEREADENKRMIQKGDCLDLTQAEGFTVDQLERAADQCGQSVNEWVLEAIREKI
ncbi:hypothetical protein [Pseudoflavonifractor phocaeensis]|uniref:hypothetical protein n=1 Tax=Pseudoflavonifractor phocaeensis TaxID=1870988 RepID=UPI001F36E254|nr:hypothetical protein [Pseudoflavonifractor phocaeensis]MCF2662525.1 hypothetical protein [Pseudoflavonifractor phocaeensis]